MRYNASKETWIPMEIKGIEGYFNDMRIDRSTVQSGFHLWELADGDSDGIPCRYKTRILVNFYGTFITTGNLPIDDTKWNEGYINSEDEWGFTGEKYYPFPYILDLELKKKVNIRNCHEINP